MIDLAGSHASMDRMLALSLASPPFPFRRDVALDAGVAGPGSGFADHFWVSPSVLAVAVAHLPGEALADVAALAMLRELLRAACRLHVDARAAIEAALAEHRALMAAPSPVDCTLLRLDLSSRAVDVAVRGEGAVGPSRGRAGPTLAPGRLVFARAGLPGLKIKTIEAETGPAEVLAAAFAAHPAAAVAGGALVVLAGGALKGPAEELTLSLANASGEVEGAQRAMEAFLEERSVPAETSMALTLVFDELFTNIVSYAFPDGRRHEIVVRLEATAIDVGLELRDDGVPFDPLRRPTDPNRGELEERSLGGLGISFARQLADGLDYERSSGWNVLRWRKRLPAAAS